MLFRFSLLLLFRDLAHVNADERGRESRIINGVEVTDPYKYGYIANIGTCGASLIAPNVLLSAAQCGDPTSVTMNKLKVASGGRQSRESFRVIDVEDHPSFYGKGLYVEYDFKLIRINGYSQNTPVLLGDGSYESKGTELTVMGWGITESGSLSDYLMEVDVDVSDFATCSSSYNPLSEMKGMTLDTDFHICAGRTYGKTYDSCNGDSGGPLVKYNPYGQDTQVGVVSFGKECGNPNYPHVYAKVSYAKDWIEQWISDWDCTPPGGRRRRRLKKLSLPATPKPNVAKKTKATKTKPGKKTKKPVEKPTGSTSVSPTITCSETVYQCPPAPEGKKWKLVDENEVDEACEFLLDNEKLKEAVALYKADPTASLRKYGQVPFWFVKDVTDFQMLFKDNDNFNADISGWDTSGVTNMDRCFSGAKSFNIDIGSWNTGKVTNMEFMFEGAKKFNQDVSMWDVSKVTSNSGIFKYASRFNQDMCPWVNSLTFMNNIDSSALDSSGCDNKSKPSKNQFCHDCTVCSDDTDCPARPCETGTCGSAGVCHYTLSRQNRLKIKLDLGIYPGTVGYELTQDGKIVMFASKLPETKKYEWDVDVCAGVHQMCLTDANKNGDHELDVTYFFNKKSVDDTSFPIFTVQYESTEKCVNFTVTAM